MDNPEKLEIQVTQDEENLNKSTTQYALDTTMRKQKQITQTRHGSSYKHLLYLFSIILVVLDLN